MDRITAARVLIETVERGSASAAADALNMSRAMASRYIASIEEWSGTRLLHRTTRRLSLTTAGERVLDLCREMVRLADRVADASTDHDTPRGRLRLTTSSVMAETVLVPLLAQFAHAYPHTTLELFISDRSVDLVQDRIDVAIRIANNLEPSLIARRLGTCPSRLYASPEYVKHSGAPQDIDDLKRHECLTYTNLGGAEWVLQKGEITTRVKVSGRFQTNDALALRRAAISGMGIAILPRLVADRDVADGHLQMVLPDWEPEELGMYALYASRNHLPAAARALIDFLAARMGRETANAAS